MAIQSSDFQSAEILVGGMVIGEESDIQGILMAGACGQVGAIRFESRTWSREQNLSDGENFLSASGSGQVDQGLFVASAIDDDDQSGWREQPEFKQSPPIRETGNHANPT